VRPCLALTSAASPNDSPGPRTPSGVDSRGVRGGVQAGCTCAWACRTRPCGVRRTSPHLRAAGGQAAPWWPSCCPRQPAPLLSALSRACCQLCCQAAAAPHQQRLPCRLLLTPAQTAAPAAPSLRACWPRECRRC
jgi:hypothetical protein